MKEERDRAVAAMNTLNGKYKAEVPRLAQQVKDLQAELATLKSSASAAPAGASGSLEVDGQDEASLREQYGDEIVDRIKQMEARAVEAAKRELQPSLERLQ